MALKLKKEIKKSSYYVWFLGAKESKGLRGLEYIVPVIDNLEERERDIEPFKVTLQVSSKGLKIVQNIVSAQNNKKPKNETIKHFIPHNTITCVHQRDDVIACILLLFNPVTKCPLHVHAYRCDSLETATMLKGQLQMLIERPENQKKFAEIESRLMPSTGMGVEDRKGEKGSKKDRLDSSIGSSDTGTSTKSESSEERFSSDVRVATLYDSVAAELRAKLNKNDVPILLPPRDYDTVHRQKGNLTGIELRRCLNVNIVGQNGKAKRMASSGGSSGIGSDHAPSPESPDVQERYHDGHSTSDEDWNADQDTELYLIDQPTYPSPLPKYDYRAEQRKPRQFDQKVTRQHLEEHIRKKLEQRNKYNGQESFNFKEDSTPSSLQRNNQYRHDRTDRNDRNDRIDRSERITSKSPEYKDYKQDYKDYKQDYEYNSKDFKDNRDFHRDNRDFRDYSDERHRNDRFTYDIDDTLKRQGHQRTLKDSHLREGRENRFEKEFDLRQQIERQIERYPDKYPENVPEKYMERHSARYPDRIMDRERYQDVNRTQEKQKFDRKEIRQREVRDASPDLEREHEQFQDNFSVLQYSPTERFQVAKEKFLLLEKKTSNGPTVQEFYAREQPISPNISKDKRNSRYYDDEPIPAPRNFKSSQDTTHLERRNTNSREASSPLERYRSNQQNQQKTDKYDIKRRSMFNLSTENNKDKDRDFYYPEPKDRDIRESRDSRTLNKEYKRRSYMDQNYRSNTEPDFDSRDYKVNNKEFKDNNDIKDNNNKYRDWDNNEINTREYQVRELRPEVKDFKEFKDRTHDRPDFRDGREGIRDMREIRESRDVILRDKRDKFTTPNQRYRNSYAEPSMHHAHAQDTNRRTSGVGNGVQGRSRFDILHRTNSTVSNNGRVGIASVHPY